MRGRVQGVFFRASAQREARRLGLTGLQVINARTAARSRLLRHMTLGDIR